MHVKLKKLLNMKNYKIFGYCKNGDLVLGEEDIQAVEFLELEEDDCE
jgi:hypothetical protein